MIRLDSIHPLAIRVVFAAGLAVVGLNHVHAEQAASVVAEASTSSVQVAEPFSLKLTVTAPVGSRVIFPSTGTQLGDFDVTETQDSFDIPDATAVDTRTWTRWMKLESIVTGKRNIPPLEVQVSGNEGSQVIRSTPVTVQVASVLENRSDPTKFRDIQSVIDVAVPTKHTDTRVWWTLSGAAGLALLAAATVVVSRRGHWVTPKEWALQELDELEKSVDNECSETETTALPLSKIVRDYLLLQYSIPESGHTPEELVRLIQPKEKLDGEIIGQLCELFALADKAKFAGLQLSPAGLKSAINDSRNLVERIANEFETNAQSINAKEDK